MLAAPEAAVPVWRGSPWGFRRNLLRFGERVSGRRRRPPAGAPSTGASPWPSAGGGTGPSYFFASLASLSWATWCFPGKAHRTWARPTDGEPPRSRRRTTETSGDPSTRSPPWTGTHRGRWAEQSGWLWVKRRNERRRKASRSTRLTFMSAIKCRSTADSRKNGTHGEWRGNVTEVKWIFC